MNYQHAYHAGSFADVFKHIVLVTVLDSLLAKDKPFVYLDTHAGIGKYNLSASEAQKTKEFSKGIELLINDHTPKPLSIENYLNIVRSMNPNHQLQNYPGSPRIVRTMLRPEDKMILTELNLTVFNMLKKEFKQDTQVAVHLLDGYQTLKAFLPLKPRRGLVLIDPPYENREEFNTILKNLKIALKKWREGIYLIWYPVKDRNQINFFQHQLQRSQSQPILMTEFNLYPDDSPLALNGSGLVIINPPWQLERKLKPILIWLKEKLDKSGLGSYKLNNLRQVL